MPDPFEGIEFTPAQMQELSVLRQGFSLLNQIVSDPKTATPAKRLIRQVKPDSNLMIPEDDIAEPLLQPLRQEIESLKTNHAETLEKIEKASLGFDEKVSAFEQKQKDQSDIADLGKKIDAAVKHYRFTDEGRGALIDHMKTTGTPDPMTAGAFLVQNIERPASIVATGLAPEQARRNGAPDLDLFQVATGHDDESLKLLHTKPDRWMETEILKIQAEAAEAA
jgi:hypothetical protein